jgi:hypothetical protein
MESLPQRRDSLWRTMDLNMLDAIVLTLVDGVRIVVPSFFEDELPFVRRALQPGQKWGVALNWSAFVLPRRSRRRASGQPLYELHLGRLRIAATRTQ